MGKPYIRYSGGGIWGTDEVNGVNVARGGGGINGGYRGKTRRGYINRVGWM